MRPKKCFSCRSSFVRADYIFLFLVPSIFDTFKTRTRLYLSPFLFRACVITGKRKPYKMFYLSFISIRVAICKKNMSPEFSNILKRCTYNNYSTSCLRWKYFRAQVFLHKNPIKVNIMPCSFWFRFNPRSFFFIIKLFINCDARLK